MNKSKFGDKIYDKINLLLEEYNTNFKKEEIPIELKAILKSDFKIDIYIDTSIGWGRILTIPLHDFYQVKQENDIKVKDIFNSNIKTIIHEFLYEKNDFDHSDVIGIIDIYGLYNITHSAIPDNYLFKGPDYQGFSYELTLDNLKSIKGFKNLVCTLITLNKEPDINLTFEEINSIDNLKSNIFKKDDQYYLGFDNLNILITDDLLKVWNKTEEDLDDIIQGEFEYEDCI